MDKKRANAIIDLDAITKNISITRKIIGDDTKIMAVVKSNAYGHGAIKIVMHMDNMVDCFAVASFHEALEIRKYTKKDILVFGITQKEELKPLIESNLTQTVWDYEYLLEIEKTAKEINSKVKIHINIDTGMNRLGIKWNDFENVLKLTQKANESKYIFLEGIYSHFTSSEDINEKFNDIQFERFKNIVDKLEKEGINIPIKHISNSAGVLNYPKYCLNMVRPGIMLYGMDPCGRDDNHNLYQAMNLESKVIQIKEVQKGETVGYSKLFEMKKDTKIAVVSIGYGDGYSRHLSNKGKVLINGNEYKVIGNVCMDLIMIDITSSNVKLFDKVVLFGKSEDSWLYTAQVAKLANTINYEITCNIGQRVERIYK